MARGWESKAVEDQVDTHKQAGFSKDKDRAKLTDAARRKQAEINSLKLSRTRIANQLAKATNPVYRTSLERALASLDNQISVVEKRDD